MWVAVGEGDLFSTSVTAVNEHLNGQFLHALRGFVHTITRVIITSFVKE